MHELSGPLVESHSYLALNAVAPAMMEPISVTWDVFQPWMSWSKYTLLKNILYMLVTDDVSHVEISWLKIDRKNIKSIFLTCDTSQEPMGWLNSCAS